MTQDSTRSLTADRIPSGVRSATGAFIGAVQIVVVCFMPLGWAGTTGLVSVVVLAMVQAIALWRQQDRPGPATAAAVGTAAAIQVLYPGIAGGGALPAVFVLANLRPPRRSLWALAAVVAFAPFQAWAVHWRAGLVMASSAALAWTLGELNRIRVARRHEAAQRIADAERARIASELHDVVAHHVSVVVVQAAAADDVFDSHPERARSAVRAIESTGRQALAELRRVVQTLPLEPDNAVPGPADIEQLADSVRATGMSVVVHRDAVPVGEDVGLAVYRIVQESLTNVVRHADARNVGIAVSVDDDAVHVEVRNDGTGSPRRSSGTGRGIRGMRRRVRALGGDLETAQHDGVFTVSARLPAAQQP